LVIIYLFFLVIFIKYPLELSKDKKMWQCQVEYLLIKAI
jgi:hypothetical protein